MDFHPFQTEGERYWAAQAEARLGAQLARPADPYREGGGNPELRREREANERARLWMRARRMERAAEAARRWEAAQVEREEEARRQLEDHARYLAEAAEHARAQVRPPGHGWLQPGDPGSISDEEWRFRLQLEERERAGRAAAQERTSRIRHRRPPVEIDEATSARGRALAREVDEMLAGVRPRRAPADTTPRPTTARPRPAALQVRTEAWWYAATTSQIRAAAEEAGYGDAVAEYVAQHCPFVAGVRDAAGGRD
jgi:hypothetical protein